MTAQPRSSLVCAIGFRDSVFRHSTCVILCGLVLSSPVLGQSDGTFVSPFVITNAGSPGPATVHSGDLDGDGKLDLVTAKREFNVTR